MPKADIGSPRFTGILILSRISGNVDNSRKVEMNTDAKRRHRQRDRILPEGARQHLEEALDDALKNTFPASDPISIEQPGGRPDGSEQGRGG